MITFNSKATEKGNFKVDPQVLDIIGVKLGDAPALNNTSSRTRTLNSAFWADLFQVLTITIFPAQAENITSPPKLLLLSLPRPLSEVLVLSAIRRLTFSAVPRNIFPVDNYRKEEKLCLNI